MNIGDIDQTPFTDSYQAVGTIDKKEYNSLGHRCKDIADCSQDVVTQ